MFRPCVSNSNYIIYLHSLYGIYLFRACIKGAEVFIISVTNWIPAFRRKGVLWFHHCQYVSLSVTKRVFSKTAHKIFLKLLILRCLEGKKLTEPDFWEKISFWEHCPKLPENRDFWILRKKICHWCIDFIGLNHAP